MKKSLTYIRNTVIAVVVLLCMIPSQTVMAYQSNNDIPVFMIMVSKGEESYFFSACYVEDTYRSGNTYLLTSHVVGNLLQSGYGGVIVSQTYAANVTGVHTDGYLTYLMVDDVAGLQAFAPMKLTAEFEPSNCVLARQNVLDEQGNMEVALADDLDLSGYTKENGIIYTNDVQCADILCGVPVLNRNIDAMGIFITPDGASMMVQDLAMTQFLEEAAIATGTGSSGGNQGGGSNGYDTGNNNGGNNSGNNNDGNGSNNGGGSNLKEDVLQGAAVGGVVGVIALLFKKGKAKKSNHTNGSGGYEPPVSPQQQDFSYTSPQEPVYEPVQQPVYASVQPAPRQEQQSHHGVAVWQIRGMNGTFKGQVFSLNGSMQIGRSSHAGIPYPPNSKGISGTHCELVEEHGQVVLRDLQSSYGTFIGNGTKLEPRVQYHLQEGDIFYLANPSESFRLERFGEERKQFKPVVKAVSSPQEGKRYYAGVDERMTFGRASHHQVVFSKTDSSISSTHCVLYRENGNVYLMDLGSSNGTFMSNGSRLKPNKPYRLKKGDSFFLVTQKYTFVIVEE